MNKQDYYFKFENRQGNQIIVPVFFEKMGDLIKQFKKLRNEKYYCIENRLPFGLTICGGTGGTLVAIKDACLFLQHDINVQFLKYLAEKEGGNNKNFFYYQELAWRCVEELKNQGKWVDLKKLIDVYESWKR